MSRRAPRLTRRQRRRALKGHPPVVGRTTFIVDELLDFHRVNGSSEEPLGLTRDVAFLDDAQDFVDDSNRAPAGFAVQDRQLGKTQMRANFRRYEGLRQFIESLGQFRLTDLQTMRLGL